MIDWASVQWVQKDPWVTKQGKLKRLIAVIPELDGMRAIGVDPGVNFGICFITGDVVDVVYGSLPKIDVPQLRWRYGIEAFKLIQELVDVTHMGDDIPAVVEGAAYNAQFGQVGLAEVRFGFAHALECVGCAVAISPPAHIRAVVMGKADHNEHTGMFGYWPTMNTNAADAVGVAAYAAGYKWRVG
jgi:hypothetical protein